MSRLTTVSRRPPPARAWIALAAWLAAACGGPERGAAETIATTQAAPPATPAVPDAPTSPPAEPPVPPALPDVSDPSWNRVTSRAGTYLVCWRTPSGAIPRNADFDLEVWVLRDGAPQPELFLDVNAWMPDHGHGMLRKPRAERQPDGSFRVEGMLLHMRGHWQLLFEMLEGTIAETAECAIDL